jgi:hypothetical protein
MYRTLCWNHHRFLKVQYRDRILKKPRRKDYTSLRTNASLTDIACLIRRDVFLKYQFQGEYAEDLDLGLRLIRDGHKLALLSSTRIIHSHNRPASYYLKRGYVDSRFLFKSFSDQTQTLEANSLIDGIILTYESLNTLLAKKLGPSAKSCSISALSIIVMGGLAVAPTRSGTTQITLERNDHVDDQFQAFIADIYKRRRQSDAAALTENGALLASFRSFVTKILQYMQEIYDVIDEPLLDDFRKSLFKAFAWICGVQLGAAMYGGSPATKDVLHDVCMNLQDSI